MLRIDRGTFLRPLKLRTIVSMVDARRRCHGIALELYRFVTLSSQSRWHQLAQLGEEAEQRAASLGLVQHRVADMTIGAPPSHSSVIVRDAGDADIQAVMEIYGFYVRHGLGTFEEVPPSADELRARRTAVLRMGLPYLVAELEGDVVGYAYASTYRPRPAYRYTVEDSVYIADGRRGQGIGMALLGTLIRRCQSGPWRQMVAVIGHSQNAASIALHRRCGFREVGTLTAVGYKLGRWVDTTLMQCELGCGAATPPDDLSMAGER